MARCETPCAIACCFSSARNLSKLAPLWQEAARGEGAVGAAALGAPAAGAGRAKGVNGCCAEADGNSRDAESAVAAARIANEEGFIIPARVSRRSRKTRKYPKPAKKQTGPAGSFHAYFASARFAVSGASAMKGRPII